MLHCIGYHDVHHGMMVIYGIGALVHICDWHDEVDDKNYDGNHGDLKNGSLHDDQRSGNHDGQMSGSHDDHQKRSSEHQSPQINH